MYQSSEYQAVHDVYWRNQQPKRGPPTPAVSAANTPQEGSVTGTGRMEVDSVAASGAALTGSNQCSTMLQPFTLETTPALQVTASSQGVDVNDYNALQPVANNLQVFNLVRAYHEKVIRPEYYTLVFQLEAGLRSVNNRVFAVRRELGWMAAENRQAQKYECGVQVLTTGWPNGLAPAQREWLLSQTPKATDFLKSRGFLTDQNAHEVKR